MNPNQTSETSSNSRFAQGEGAEHHRTHSADEMEEYAGGYIKARHGKINAWLIVVIVGLILWGIYYGFTYWGGLGEGLDF
jgi:hypothetical protein